MVVKEATTITSAAAHRGFVVERIADPAKANVTRYFGSGASRIALLLSGFARVGRAGFTFARAGGVVAAGRPAAEPAAAADAPEIGAIISGAEAPPGATPSDADELDRKYSSGGDKFGSLVLPEKKTTQPSAMARPVDSTTTG